MIKEKICNFHMAGEITSEHYELPEESLIEVFLRSSVKSLLHAECVCRNWYALIRKTKFPLMHLQYQKCHAKGRILLQYFEKDNEQYKYALFDDETLVSNSYHDIDYFQFPYDSIHMEGPINGLYCFFDWCDHIILWNPALMEVRILPLPQTHSCPRSEVHNNYIGLGINPFTHDYKIVLIRILIESNAPPFVLVYNLTTNTWKLLQFGDFDINIGGASGAGSFLIGSYYWCTMDGELIAFDMGEETFRHIFGPYQALSESSYRYYLTTYNDKVAFLQQCKFSIDVWVMLEEGIWVKQFSAISFTSLPWFIGVLKDDKLLLADHGVKTCYINPSLPMVLYNDSTEEMRNVGPVGTSVNFTSSIYYESLVSVNSGTRHKGMCASLYTISDFLLH